MSRNFLDFTGAAWALSRISLMPAKSNNLTGLDQLLSRKIIDILKEYLRALEESDIAKRQHEMYQVDALASITYYAKIEDLVKSPFSLELCKKNNWIIKIPKNN